MGEISKINVNGVEYDVKDVAAQAAAADAATAAADAATAAAAAQATADGALQKNVKNEVGSNFEIEYSGLNISVGKSSSNNNSYVNISGSVGEMAIGDRGVEIYSSQTEFIASDPDGYNYTKIGCDNDSDTYLILGATRDEDSDGYQPTTDGSIIMQSWGSMELASPVGDLILTTGEYEDNGKGKGFPTRMTLNYQSGGMELRVNNETAIEVWQDDDYLNTWVGASELSDWQFGMHVEQDSALTIYGSEGAKIYMSTDGDFFLIQHTEGTTARNSNLNVVSEFDNYNPIYMANTDDGVDRVSVVSPMIRIAKNRYLGLTPRRLSLALLQGAQLVVVYTDGTSSVTNTRIRTIHVTSAIIDWQENRVYLAGLGLDYNDTHNWWSTYISLTDKNEDLSQKIYNAVMSALHLG